MAWYMVIYGLVTHAIFEENNQQEDQSLAGSLEAEDSIYVRNKFLIAPRFLFYLF